MSFPRYKQYKDSGVEWLGEVPEHWKLGKLHHIAILNPAKAELGDIDPQTAISFLPMEAFGTKGDPSLSLERTISQVETGYTYFRDGDVAFAKVTPCFENGKRAIFSKLTNGIGFGTTELIVLRARSGQTVPKFLYWLVATSEFLGLGEGSMYGAGGLKRIPESFVHQFSVCIPGIDEQTFIVTFLDQETAKIDALIEEQRLLIELLKEKRQAVISHAVTKGLNTGTPLTDSGVEWLGTTPEHWRKLRIGAMFREVNDAGVDGLPILSVSIHHGVSDKQLDDEEMERTVTRSDDQTKYKRVRSGDLVYNMMRAWQGGFGTVTVDGMVSPAYVVARPSSGYLSRFVEFILRTPCAVEEMRRYSQGVTDFRLRLYWDKFKCFQLSMPPLSEQEDILAYIDTKTTEFDRLMGISERAISILIERRNALISAAVTGKIDVRSSMRKGVASVKPYTSAFAHQVLAAKILANCNDSHTGRTKLQKLIHVTEYHAQIEDLRGNYTRKMAGPLNMKAMISLEQGLEKQGWYKTVKSDQRYRYVPLDKPERHSKYMDRWNDKAARIDQVLSLMGNMTMHQCEIVSTLYAAWNDLLIDQLIATDEAILAQASTAEGWHKKKEHTPREKWVAALGWMKKVGLVPTGFGTHTRKVAPEDSHEPA